MDSIYNCKEFGFQVNIEFIFGHPGMTVENWKQVMEKAVTMPVEEIQLYRLKVKSYGDLQGNIIKLREKDAAVIPSFEETMTMKQVAIDILKEHGYLENLRRVYSKEKKHFSHYAYNQCCNLYDQVGFGLTAFGSFRDRFALNTQDFAEYYALIEAGRLPLNRGYIRDREQQLRWSMVLPLKNRDIRKADFVKINGIPLNQVFRKKIAKLKEFGLLEETEQVIRLTEIGAFVADEVVEQFNANEFMPFPPESFADGPLHPYADNSTQDALEE
jgi:oxygen-independent coproporphyrinogen-3 oxidase